MFVRLRNKLAQLRRKTSRNQVLSLGIFLVVASLAIPAVMLEEDIAVRLGIASLLTAYGGLTFHIVSSEDQARVRQRHHDELIAALKKMERK